MIGKESGVWNTLKKLAKAPVVLIFGDGKAKIQPIYIDDLIDCILTFIDDNIFKNETFDLGGPEEIAIEDFLKRIHQIYSKKDPLVIHLPLSLLIPVLSLLEKPFFSFLPFSVGQLSPFRYDSTIERNRLFKRHFSQLKNVDKMLRLVINNESDQSVE